MAEAQVFFQAENLQQKLKTIQDVLTLETLGKEPFPGYISSLSTLIAPLLKQQTAPMFDRTCKYFIQTYKDDFEKAVNDKSAQLLIGYLYILYMEYILRTLNPGDYLISTNGINTQQFQAALGRIRENRREFPVEIEEIISGAHVVLPFEVARMEFHDGDLEKAALFFDEMRRIQRESTDLSQKASAQTMKLEKLLQDLGDTEKSIRHLQTEANFVGLDKGLLDLKTSRSERKKGLTDLVRGFGVAMAAIPVLAAVSHAVLMLRWDFKFDVNSTILFTVPFIAIELVMLYFFRLSYSQLASLESQIMQIDLRRSLVQFIESYSEFSTKIKEKDKDALEKFESVIFSNIMSSDDKIPSTFDGVEQLAGLVKALKPGS